MIYNVLKKPDVFYIGKQDENNAETIDIDYSAWVEKYGEGVITATFQGAADENPYDIVLTTANGIATWTVTDANTVAAGVGKLQLNYVVDEVVAKSLIWTVRVYPSMRASGEAPGGYQDWLTALQGLSAETQQNAQNAANSATEAEEYAEQAKASADSITGLTVEAETLPAGSSATASFDADTDKLSLGIPRGDKGEKGDTGQDGITPDLTIGTTETLPAGSSATATITGTKENPVLNLGIPQGTQGIQGERGGKGDTGATPDISIGTVETLNPDESATATITGTAEDPVLNLGIPKGDTGSAGADGFSPSASVTKQDGSIVITVTDKDGTTSETLEVDNALDEDSVNPVQNAAIVEAMRSMLPVDTASGAIASFPDGANDVPMLSLKAQIEPVQDLHGYDSPWPAGGGKNKFDYNATYAAFKQSDGTFRGTASQIISISYNIPSGVVGSQLTFSAFLDLTNSGTLIWVRCRANVSGSWINGNLIANGASGYSSVTFTPTSADDYVIFDYSSNGGNLYTFSEVQLELGSTASAWTPYSNECPISGHTEVNISHSGADMTNPDIIPVSWETEAGTVYGGTLDVVSGKLTVDRAMVDLGSLTYIVNNHATLRQYFYAPIDDLGVKYEGAFGSRVYNALCSAYKVVTRSHAYLVNGTFCFDGTQTNEKVTQIQIKNTAYTDAIAFKQAMQGVQLCYELAEPIEYTITAHEVKTYLGQNNLWNDVGDTEVTYRADIQKFIEKKVNG